MANDPDTGSSEEFPVGPRGLQKHKDGPSRGADPAEAKLSAPAYPPAHNLSEAEGRRTTNRVLWAIAGGVMFGVAVFAAMAWYAHGQRQLAEQRQNDVEVAVSKSHDQSARMLAVTAASIFDKAPPLALLLATESLNISKGTDNEQILRSMLAQPTGIPLKGSGPSLAITTVAISRDGRWIVSGGNEGKVRVWNREHPNAEPQILSGHGSESWISAVAVSGDGRWVYLGLLTAWCGCGTGRRPRPRCWHHGRMTDWLAALQ